MNGDLVPRGAFAIDMEQQCGRKIGLLPTKAQIRTAYRMCAVSRRAYNWKLAVQNAAYEEAKANTPEGEKVKCKLGTPIDWHKEWCIHKKLPENKWMTEVSKFCGQEALIDLGSAWKRFFKGLAKHPRFHKYGENESFRCSGGVFIGRDFVQLPTLGRVRLAEKNYIKIPDGTEKVPIAMATVSVDPTGHWSVSFAYHIDVEPLYKANEEITFDDIEGIDLGVKDSGITSSGIVYSNPKAYRHYMKRIKRLQRSVSRKHKKSKNRKKARKRLAKAWHKVTCIRVNHAHQMTSDLTYKLQPKMIVMETLRPGNMAKNHNLANSILDANFGRIKEFLKYKCNWLGIKLIFAPQFYASSRFCSHCGCYHNDNLTLSDREWTCPVCGCHHDRDANAAVNLKFYGQWLAGLIQTDENLAARLAVGGSSADACPAVYQREGVTYVSPRDRRLQFFESNEQCLSMKQELNSMTSLT